MNTSDFGLSDLAWTEEGLLPVIVQDHSSNEVLMFAWMNHEALARSVELGEAVFWSRSRRRLWHKGESSGHTQKIHEFYADCDRDVLLLKVEQIGGIACHTGRGSCFFHRLEQDRWRVAAPVLKDPSAIYGDSEGKP